MALNPNISLQVQPPQIPQIEIQSPLDRFQKVQTLRGLMEQGQLRALQMQRVKQEIEEARREEERQQRFRAIFENQDTVAPASVAPGAPAIAPSRSPLFQPGYGELMTTQTPATMAGATPESFFPSVAPQPEPRRLPSTTQVLGVLGTKGLPVVKSFAEIATEERKAEVERLKVDRERWDRFASIAGTITDDKSKNAGVLLALSQGLIKPAQARELFARPYDAAEYTQFHESAIAAKDQADVKLKQAQLPGTQAKALGEQLETAVMVMPNSKEVWEQVWYPMLPKPLQALISPAYSPQEADRVRAMIVKPTAAEPGKDIPFAPGVFQQKKELAVAGAPSLLSPDVEAQRIRITKAGQEGPAAVRAETRAQNIGTQWQQSSKLLERYRMSASNYDSVRQMLTGGGPQDLSVIYAFAKAVDPESVVRESEVETAMKTGNIFRGALARFNGLWNPRGGFLSPEVKQDFLNVIRTRMDSTRRQVLAERNEIKRQQEVISPGSSEALYDPTVLDPEDIGKPNGPAAGHVIELNGKRYRYKGSGATDDLSNYTEVK
jgi:hypothetical protein